MAIEECKTMVETLNHDILGYSTLFSEELQLIDWLTHTEEISQVSSAWRSVKQNHACSALEECPKPLLVDGYGGYTVVLPNIFLGLS
jgi:hypothetical protein